MGASGWTTRPSGTASMLIAIEAAVRPEPAQEVVAEKPSARLAAQAAQVLDILRAEPGLSHPVEKPPSPAFTQ